MAIRSILLRGYGNGTFNGTISLVVTRGYAIGVSVLITTPEGRIYPVKQENRIYSINQEDRVYNVDSENRIYPVGES